MNTDCANVGWGFNPSGRMGCRGRMARSFPPANTLHPPPRCARPDGLKTHPTLSLLRGTLHLADAPPRACASGNRSGRSVRSDRSANPRHPPRTLDPLDRPRHRPQGEPESRPALPRPIRNPPPRRHESRPPKSTPPRAPPPSPPPATQPSPSAASSPSPPRSAPNPPPPVGPPLDLPFANATLGAITLDGETALLPPTREEKAARPAVVLIRGRGEHALQISFTVPITR